MSELQEIKKSRDRLLESITNMRHKLFEQDLEIQDLQTQAETMRKTIGSLRAQIVILESNLKEKENSG